MTDYGVTETGFVKKTLDDILKEVQNDELDDIRSDLGLLGTNVFGQINGIFCDKLAEMWDVAETVYRSPYPDSASGEALDQVCSITGATRLEAKKSTVILDQLFIDDGVTLDVGDQVGVGSDGPGYELTESVTNSSGAPVTVSAEAESLDYGPVQGYAGTIDTIRTPKVGWSAAAALTCVNSENYALDGKSITFRVDRDHYEAVNFSLGDPWTAADAAAEIVTQTSGMSAVDANGKVRIASTTEGEGSSIEVTGGSANSIFGFPTDEVKGFNTEDAEPGSLVEEDWALRIRREQLLRVVGAAAVEAIRSRVRELPDVEQVFVFENFTDDDLTGSGGLPPHSFEVVVQGGDPDQIAETIWQVKPAGIRPYGSEFRTITDSQGFDHDMYYSRPVEVPIYLTFNVVVDSGLFPVDGANQVKAAIKTYGDELSIGEDVIVLQFKCVPLSVAGVQDVTSFWIDDITPPSGDTNIPIAPRERATFDTGDITVNVIPA